jgi:hypothetical protein
VVKCSVIRRAEPSASSRSHDAPLVQYGTVHSLLMMCNMWERWLQHKEALGTVLNVLRHCS